MGSACRTFFDRIHEKYSGPLAKPIAFANRFSLLLHAAASWIIYFIMEAVSRHSVPAAWEFMTGSTAAFAYNSFMIFMSFMLVYLFRRRIFMRLLIAFFWLVLGIINGTILSSRVTPFTGQDLHLITDALDIVGNYMSPVQLILKAGGIVLGIAVLVLLWKYAPKYQGRLRYPLNLAALAAVDFTREHLGVEMERTVPLCSYSAQNNQCIGGRCPFSAASRAKPRVAFVCVHNSCRSQMAEALSKKLAGDVFESCSAGTETKPKINQDAVRLMKQVYGVDMEEGQYSKLLSELPPVDIVVTMGCNVQCPTLPCSHREDWGLDDPSGKDDGAFLAVMSAIEEKVLDLKRHIQAGELG